MNDEPRRKIFNIYISNFTLWFEIISKKENKNSGTLEYHEIRR